MQTAVKLNQWINPWAKPEVVEPSTLSKIRYAAEVTGVVIGAGVTTAAAMYVAGVGLGTLGVILANAATESTFLATPQVFTSQALVNVGAWLVSLGETVFLAIAVPVYGLGYEVPRLAIKHAVPHVCQAFQYTITHILTPALEMALNRLECVGKAMGTAFQAAVEFVAARIIQPALDFVLSYLKNLDGVLTTLSQYGAKVTDVALKMFERVNDLTQVALTWAYDVVISPSLKVADTLIQHIWGFIMKGLPYVEQLLGYCAELAERTWVHIGDASAWIFEKVVSPAIQEISKQACNAYDLAVIQFKVIQVKAGEGLAALQDLMIRKIKEVGEFVSGSFNRVTGS